MRLISLNTWCGQIYEPLIDFIKNYSQNTDIFCFQEIRNGKYADIFKEEEKENLYSEIEKVLPNFNGYFCEQIPGVGLATFINKKFEIEKVASSEILSKEDLKHIRMENGSSYYPRVIQSVYFKKDRFSIHNFHGIPGNKKRDTPEREIQNKKLLEILKKNKGAKIIAGDFNLDMQTKAICNIENLMTNLIKESGTKTTRNHHYEKHLVLPFADYIFVSKEIIVNKFEVLPHEVSDHLALLLDFN